MPRQARVAAGIAGGEQAAALGIAALVERLVRGTEQPPRTPQGVTPVAAVAQDVVLDSAAQLVDAVIRQADDVERIRNLAAPDSATSKVSREAPERSNTPLVLPSRLVEDCTNSQPIGASASRPAAGAVTAARAGAISSATS